MPASMQNRQHAVAFIVILVLIESIGFGIILPVMPQLIMGLGDVSLSSASAWSARHSAAGSFSGP